jgi:adenylate cyclase
VNGRSVVPVWKQGQLLGLLFVSEHSAIDRYSKERSVRHVIATHVQAAIDSAEGRKSPGVATPSQIADSSSTPTVLRVRRVSINNSIFINGHYAIKGVAGAVLWVLIKRLLNQGLEEFSTQELRFEADLQLPGVHENLGPRIVLLQQRLNALRCGLHILRTGRGRFRFSSEKTLHLED